MCVCVCVDVFIYLTCHITHKRKTSIRNIYNATYITPYSPHVTVSVFFLNPKPHLLFFSIYMMSALLILKIDHDDDEVDEVSTVPHSYYSTTVHILYIYPYIQHHIYRHNHFTLI
jgi:hypothetical protein